MSHTLLLIQPTRKLESRTYGDFESLNEEMVLRIDYELGIFRVGYPGGGNPVVGLGCLTLIGESWKTHPYLVSGLDEFSGKRSRSSHSIEYF